VAGGDADADADGASNIDMRPAEPTARFEVDGADEEGGAAVVVEEEEEEKSGMALRVPGATVL